MADTHAASLGPERFLNRELSWLAFNERVLALAEDERQPLLERVKFAAIFSGNLDEFFQVRVAGLKAQLDAGVMAASADGRSPAEQLQEIHVRVEALVQRQERIFAKQLVPELAGAEIEFVSWDTLDADDRRRLAERFDKQIHPALTPLAVDPAHPFPWISNLSLNLGVMVADPASGERRFARLKVPPVFPRFVDVGDGRRFFPVERLIGAHLDSLFPGMQVVSAHCFRVTRDADLLVPEGEADDLLSAIQSGLHRRLRVNDAVRLEIDADAPEEVRRLLARELDLGESDVYASRELIDLASLWQIHGIDRPELRERIWVPVTQRRLARSAGGRPPDLFAVVRAGDVLVHHPYDSYRTSTEVFIEQAAADPDVLAIKHTLYRTAERDNRTVRALTQAAKQGKEVVALVEIKARFDEESNIEWARSLEAAGVNVVYGIVGLKTHCKVALIVRRESDGLRRYCQLGTGNYNPDTARVYEDLSLFTASPEIGDDVGELFNYLTGFGHQAEYRKLLVAPEHLRRQLIERIRAEAAQPDGRIAIKVNGVSDPEVIDALYAASQAGVSIDLLVRGICCLRPGVAGLSENIRVRSLVGRFLEHSRIFRFGSAARGPQYYLGSADLMARNLGGRVELLVPVDDALLRARLEEILQVNLDPRASHWSMQGDGSWRQGPESDAFSTHARMQELAVSR